MSTTLTITNLKAGFTWDFQNVLTGIGNTSNRNSSSYAANSSGGLANGTAINQADLLYVATGTIAASSSLNVDLSGSLLDFFGNTILFARIKLLFIQLTTDTTASSINVGGAASNGFANWISSAGTFATDQPKVSVRNGGALFLCAPDATGYPVTAATADILKLTNADSVNVATYKIAFLGCSA